MRVSHVTIGAVLIAMSLAGCADETGGAGGELLSFTATYEDRDGWTLDATLGPPEPVLSADMETRLAYPLRLAFNDIPDIGDKKTTYFLDGTGRVVAVKDECTRPPCEVVYWSWQEAGAPAPFLLVQPGIPASSPIWGSPSLNMSAEQVDIVANGPSQWWLDFSGTLNLDDHAAPLRIVGQASLSPGFRFEVELTRAAINEGAALPSIDAWLGRPTPVSWGDFKEFPAEFEADLFGYGPTARQAFDHLMNESEQARTRLDGGCLHQVSVLPGPHSGGNVAGPVDWQTVYPANDTRFNFVISNAAGDAMRWVVEIRDEPLGRNISIDGPFENHFTTACEMRQPAASLGYRNFKDLVEDLPLPSGIKTVAWRWDMHHTFLALDQSVGLEKYGYVFIREEDAGAEGITIPSYVTMRAGIGQWDAMLVPPNTIAALLEYPD